MSLPIKILIFLLSNILGFFAATIIIMLALKFNFMDIDAPGFDPKAIKDIFIVRVFLTWIICGLFSISGFFVRGVWRIIFLLAPCVLPYLYGIMLLRALV
jgi:hypothetical protein